MLTLIISFFFRLFSQTYLTEAPKVINNFEGFRSKKSMSSQSNWILSQKLAANAYQKIYRTNLIIGSIIAILEILSFIFLKEVLSWIFLLELMIFFISCSFIKWYVDNQLS